MASTALPSGTDDHDHVDRPAGPVQAGPAGRASPSDRLIRALPFLSLGLVLVLWQLAATLGVVNPSLTSKPTAVVDAAWDAFANRRLTADILFTLRALAAGLVGGTLVGSTIGLALGRMGPLHQMFEWVLLALNAMPTFAFAPIFIVTLGLGLISKFAVAFLGVLIPVAVMVAVGVRELKSEIRDAGRVFGVSGWNEVWKLDIPSSVPYLLLGMKLGLTKALLAVIVAEMLNPLNGFGRWIVSSSISLNVDQATFIAVLVGITGALAVQAVSLLRKWVAPWAEQS